MREDRLGPWVLLDLLGEGGTATVYLARRVDDTDADEVALKVMRPELARDSDLRRRFVREARASLEVVHPRLVPVLDAGEADGLPYLALRLVTGPLLADRLAVGPLPLADVLATACDVGAALDALHRAGIVHRDVKPSNLLLDPEGHAMLGDLGLAHHERDSVLTQVGDVVGTIDYLAPERIRGQPAVPASDIYSLGCLVFECLAGVAPFAHLPFLEAAKAHIEADPSDPCAGRTDIPAALAWPVRQALAKDPARRPATAGAFANLLALAAGDPGARDRLNPDQA